MCPKCIMILFLCSIVFFELDFVTGKIRIQNGKKQISKSGKGATPALGRQAKKAKMSSESEEPDDNDNPPDEAELQDRWKCVTDLNTCIETELAYNNAAHENKTREICTKQIKIFQVCREFKEHWKVTKPTTTRKPRTRAPTTTTTTAPTTTATTEITTSPIQHYEYHAEG